ncbi:response regulator [Nocardioides sp.]|uniref:response regulator n=1 Tax=Nocardioides sp. TaxID=35761 RepID=UPI003569FEFE
MEPQPQLFRHVVESSTDGLWLIDEDGRTLYANERMARLLGREHATMADFSPYDALDEDGRAQFDAHLAEMRAGHPGEENLESRFVRADGSTIWGLVSWQPLYDDEGVRIGWLHRVTEYTERKELLEQLRERERQFAEAQQIAMIGSWEWDVAADRVRWSDQLYRIYNLEPQEFAATYQAFLDFIHPEDRARVERAVTSTFHGPDTFNWDARIIRKGGEIRWVRGMGVVERGPDGLPVKMGGTSQDITHLVRADQVAAAATQRLLLLHQLATDANAATELEEAYSLAAQALIQHSNWSPVCVYRRTPSGGLVSTPLEGRPGAPAAAPDPSLARHALTTRRLSHGAVGIPHPSRCLAAVPVKVGDEVTAVLEVVLDQAAPDDDATRLLEQVAAQLGTVTERTRAAAELAAARDEAMEASRLKSEFLATMSHEIRTPMNGVIGLNDLLLRTELDDNQRRLAEGLQSAGSTLLAIINDVLDLSKIESGKLVLETEDFDVRELFERTAALLSGPAHEKGLELVVACHPEVPLTLRGDAVRLGQVLTNLGANAVKFTDRGEVIVQASLVSRDSERVVLRVDVTDTGVGIAPEEQDRLFEAFSQGDPSTTRRHGGTGLGLAISRQLVDALGGEITVQSAPGIGSTFTFTAAFTPAQGLPSGRTGAPSELAGRRVLVVDDNETNRFILEEQLQAWHMRPVAVASAEEAMATLREAARAQQPFDVALLDLVMPGVDGLELARRIRADATLGQISLLLLSSANDVDPQLARASGVRASLTKPVRHSQLHEALLDIVAPSLPATSPDTPTETPSTGTRVLVVEDNPINQLVAVGLVEHLGYDVDTAHDGAEAVRILRGDHPYAAVLMDCRMPEMDGYEATRTIRSNEPDGRRVPIIAMTASALQGDRERCLASGMDDFLPKPIDPHALARVLTRWTLNADADADPDADAEPDLEPDHGPAASTDSEVLDQQRVNVLHELRMDGVSFFERTAAAFSARVPGQLDALRDAVARGDAATLRTTAHQLKGSALNLGLPLLGSAAAALETASGAPTSEQVRHRLDEVCREADRGLAALAREASRLA